jgi:hypothetical protein
MPYLDDLHENFSPRPTDFPDRPDLDDLEFLLYPEKKNRAVFSYSPTPLDLAPNSTDLFDEFYQILLSEPVFETEIDRSLEIENCFPVIVFDDRSTFQTCFEVPCLKFDVFCDLLWEPLSIEWLRELHLPTDEAFLQLHYELGLSTSIVLANDSFVANEVFSPIVTNLGMTEEVGNVPNELREKLLKAEQLPEMVTFNLLYFDLEDISQFGYLFPNLEMNGRELTSNVLLRHSSKMIVLFQVAPEDISLSCLIDCVVRFGIVVIVTTSPPEFIGPDSIRWRFITSRRQIGRAILPFLVASKAEHLAAEGEETST